MDQMRKFDEKTSRILEFKPEGLEGYNIYFNLFTAVKNWGKNLI